MSGLIPSVELTAQVPLIETERLILRGPRMDDFEAHATDLMSERTQFVGGPYDREGAWRNFCRVAGHWTLRGFGFWIVEDKATNIPAGRVGMTTRGGYPEPELGWHVYGGFEGMGYAYEAAIAARDYAQTQMGFAPMISYISPENTRSRALAERMGAVVEGEGELVGHKVLIYRHIAVTA